MLEPRYATRCCLQAVADGDAVVKRIQGSDFTREIAHEQLWQAADLYREAIAQARGIDGLAEAKASSRFVIVAWPIISNSCMV